MVANCVNLHLNFAEISAPDLKNFKPQMARRLYQPLPQYYAVPATPILKKQKLTYFLSFF